MVRRLVVIATCLVLLAGCTISIAEPGVGYREVRHGPLSQGTYSMKRGSYLMVLDILEEDGHGEDGSVRCALYADSILSDEYVLVGIYEGCIRHRTLEYSYRGDVTYSRHEDRYVFETYEGSSSPYDCEDLSGIYSFRHAGGKDVSDNPYGHLYVPVAGTRTRITYVGGYGASSHRAGALEGVWTKEP